MPALRQRFLASRGSDKSVHRRSKCTASRAVRKLGASRHLIAPAHTLTLPCLDGIRNRFEVSHGFEAALPPVRMMIEKGMLVRKHLDAAPSVIEVLRNALTDIVVNASGLETLDEFGVDIQLTDRLDEHRSSGECLFFIWDTDRDVEYIPLRPVFDALTRNPHRERLMASLYSWIYRSSSRVFWTFGLEEADNVYKYRTALYRDSRESGEDVDIEGDVEFADLSTVVSYISQSRHLKLKSYEVDGAIASIKKPSLRDAFRKAHEMYILSQQIRLPHMTSECQQILHDAEYYMSGDAPPTIGLSHWKDDAVVAWLDDVCQDIFNSGMDSRPPIIRCFRPNDTTRFCQILTALPKMVHVSVALSQWVRIVREMENAGHYSDR
jgi:hypothetical protein